MGRVVVVGSFNVDHVWRVATLPAPGATLSGEYATGPGGKGFNQAIAACRAGAPTRFTCALGEDAGAQLARGLCADDGIDLRAAASEAPTGTAGIHVDAAGRNAIVIGAGANAALGPAHAQAALADLAAGDVVLAQLESPHPAIEAALACARAAGALALLNPAPANAAPAPALLALADVLTPNETEFAALLERHTSHRVDADAIVATADAQLHRLCRTLLPRGTVVVTLGAAGAFVSHREDLLRGDAAPFYRVPAERVEAVDTTGAGDAFNGALAAALAGASGEAFEQHIRFAARYAAQFAEAAQAAFD